MLGLMILETGRVSVLLSQILSDFLLGVSGGFSEEGGVSAFVVILSDFSRSWVWFGNDLRDNGDVSVFVSNIVGLWVRFGNDLRDSEDVSVFVSNSFELFVGVSDGLSEG